MLGQRDEQCRTERCAASAQSPLANTQASKPFMPALALMKRWKRAVCRACATSSAQ